MSVPVRGESGQPGHECAAGVLVRANPWPPCPTRALPSPAQSGLLPPCNDGPVNDTCASQAPWSARAQAAVSGAEGAYLPAFAFHANVTDAMRRVADAHPVHLPNITNKWVCGLALISQQDPYSMPLRSCSLPTDACTLQMHTVTENSYDALYWASDVALYPNTAHEVRVSRPSCAESKRAGRRPLAVVTRSVVTPQVKMTSRQNALIHAGVPPDQVRFS